MNFLEKGDIIVVFLCILFFLLSGACKELSPKQPESFSAVVAPEIDIHKITEATVVNFKILKTSTIGQTPRNRFYWVSIDTKVSLEKAEQLADAIIREAIAKTRDPYHSFTIHFYFADDLKRHLENSKAMARANFLPKGGWSRVDCEPINDYKNYKLTCKLVE